MGSEEVDLDLDAFCLPVPSSMLLESLSEVLSFDSSSICSKFSFRVFFGDGSLSISGFHFSVEAVWSAPEGASSVLDSDISLHSLLTGKSWSLAGDKDLDLLLAGD